MAGIASICLGTALLGTGQRRPYEGAPPYVYALAVGLTIALYSVVDKLGVGTVHPMVYISSLSTLTALILLPSMGWQRWDGCREAWTHRKVYIGIIGVGSIGTYLLILFAYRLGPASYIVAVREFAVVIGALLGVMFLHERLTLRKVAASCARAWSRSRSGRRCSSGWKSSSRHLLLVARLTPRARNVFPIDN